MTGKFSNTEISFKILLALPVPHRLSKEVSLNLKYLTKNYFRNTITQKSLTELATVATQNELAN